MTVREQVLFAVIAVAIIIVLSLRAWWVNGTAYTLYRDSALAEGPAYRVHVATFDSADGEDYNRENCDVARGLFQAQPGVTVKYWCAKGTF